MRSIAARQIAEARAASIAELAAARQDLKWVREDAERKAQALDSAQTLLDKAEQRLRDTFQALAADALKENRASFLDLATDLVRGISAADCRVAEPRGPAAQRGGARAHRNIFQALGAGRRVGIDCQLAVARVAHTCGARPLGRDAARRVVEVAGMLQRCDFDEQPGVPSDNGRLRPDLIVHLPGGKQIVVDAKTPLEAFLDAQECVDDERARAGSRRTRGRCGITWTAWATRLLGPVRRSPEMVVMFLPGETLFSAALQQDLTLIEHGLEQRVLLASPITLIALLTTVAHSWRHEALTENYREVARLGKEFYERLATFADRFDDREKTAGRGRAGIQRSGRLLRVPSACQRASSAGTRCHDGRRTSAGRSDRTCAPGAQTAGLMGLPEGATTDDDLPDSRYDCVRPA